MKILLSDKEAMNIISRISQEELEMGIHGEFNKWDVQKVEDGYSLEYIYTDKGDLKPKFVKKQKSEVEDES